MTQPYRNTYVTVLSSSVKRHCTAFRRQIACTKRVDIVRLIYPPLQSPFRFHEPAVGHHFDHGERAHPALVVRGFTRVPSAVRVRRAQNRERTFAAVRAPDFVLSGLRPQRIAVLEPRDPRPRYAPDLFCRTFEFS